MPELAPERQLPERVTMPLLTLIVDVQTAVAVLMIPLVLSNLIQAIEGRGTLAIVNGSVGRTRYNIGASQRSASTARGTPVAMPIATAIALDRTTAHNAAVRGAPSARRTPSSRQRAVTADAVRP